MKKALPIIIIVLFLLGAGYFFMQKQGGTGVPGTGGNAITNIKDAIARSQSIKCEYTDEEGRKVTSYIKGESNMRVEVPGQQGNLLYANNKMYIWDDSKKEGTVMSLDVEAMKDQAQEAPQSDQSTQNYEATVEELEKYKDACKVQNVPASVFEVPSDVRFVDFEQQMKDAGVDVEKLMRQYGQEAPSQ